MAVPQRRAFDVLLMMCRFESDLTVFLGGVGASWDDRCCIGFWLAPLLVGSAQCQLYV